MFLRPRGTRDFLPEEMKKRRKVEGIIRKIFESYGYEEIMTPTFEHIELITAKSGEEIRRSIYNFRDKGNRELALRPELTAPVMRVYANELQFKPKPIRLYYIANCFRYERPQAGRFREFWQAGIELIGSSSPLAVAEIISLANDVLNELGLKDYEINIGHIGILREILSGIDENKQNLVLHYVDKGELDKVREILENENVDLELFFNVLEMKGNKSILNKLSNEEISNAVINHIHEFMRTLDILDSIGISYEINLGIARGLEYYSGLVFEIYASRLGAQKQICGGGVYSLAHIFGAKPTPTCGFAFGFDRLMLALEKEGLLKDEKEIRFLLIPMVIEKETFEVFRIVRRFYPCEMEVMERKLKKALEYANSRGISHVIIIGEDELKKGEVAIKDMEKNIQTNVKISELEDFLKKLDEN